jgi:hypothetical protein
LGAWATLFLASKLHIDTLQVLGDSRIIIEWLSSRGELQVVSLLAWKDRIRQLQSTFNKLSYTHIHREYNNSVDQLSKATLLKPARVISYNLWIEGHEPPPLSIPALRSVYSCILSRLSRCKAGQITDQQAHTTHPLPPHSWQLLLTFCSSDMNFSALSPPFELDFHPMLIERQPLVKVQLSSNIARL